VLRCSDLARALGEPLAGTASYAKAYVALEQPGPWGPKALLASHLDPAVGVALNDATADLPVTAVLVRQVGHHADHHVADRPRHAWVAWTGTEPWLRHAVLDDPAEVLDLDLAALADGHQPVGFGAPDPERLLLVCTNARRDQCCALRGRPVATELAGRVPGRVWESSHLGGHRFAPSILSLPDGFVYAGDDGATLTVAASRGRTHLARPEQAAELAALTAWGEPAARALDVHVADGRWVVSDPADPGRSPLVVDVVEAPLEPPRPESCGKEAVTSSAFAATVVRPAAGPRLGS
jgi:hypothetical protein